MQNYHKKYLLLTILFAFLMFVWVIVAVSLTGGREISDFTEQDRQFFAVFGAVELLNLFLLFLFAKKARKTPLPEVEPFPVDKVQRRRGILLFISALMLAAFVEWFSCTEMVAKLITEVFVVISNYIFSKLFIFRKKDN